MERTSESSVAVIMEKRAQLGRPRNCVGFSKNHHGTVKTNDSKTRIMILLLFVLFMYHKVLIKLKLG